MDKFVLNDPAQIGIEIFNEADVLTDPSALRFEYRKGDQTLVQLVWQTDAELVRDSVGTFHVNLPNNISGRWKWHCESDGIKFAAQGDYRVLRKNTA